MKVVVQRDVRFKGNADGSGIIRALRPKRIGRRFLGRGHRTMVLASQTAACRHVGRSIRAQNWNDHRKGEQSEQQ